jgi:ketosteroid isomerase-like protein
VGGKPRRISGRYVVLWRKDTDGVWRLHRDMGVETLAKP